MGYKTSFSLEDKTREKLRVICALQKKTRSQVIEEALELYLSKYQKSKNVDLDGLVA